MSLNADTVTIPRVQYEAAVRQLKICEEILEERGHDAGPLTKIGWHVGSALTFLKPPVR